VDDLVADLIVAGGLDMAVDDAAVGVIQCMGAAHLRAGIRFHHDHALAAGRQGGILHILRCPVGSGQHLKGHVRISAVRIRAQQLYRLIGSVILRDDFDGIVRIVGEAVIQTPP